MSLFEFESNEIKTKKVLIYGYDGTGKSYFADKYCKDHGLNYVCIDFDKTNTIAKNKLKFKISKNGAFNMKKYIKIIAGLKENGFDTIVFDNFTALSNSLIGDSHGLAKYSERGAYWNELVRELINSDINFIFIGQIDVDIVQEDIESKTKPSQLLVGLHSIVNEKYKCARKDKEFAQIVEKYRGHDEYLDKTYEDIRSNLLGDKDGSI